MSVHQMLPLPRSRNVKHSEDKLLSRIMDRMRFEKKITSVRRRFFYFSAAFCGSVAVFLGACLALQNALVQSELFQILSLLFSNPGAIIANWQDFGLFVLESLPTLSFAGFLLAAVLLIASARFVVRYAVELVKLAKRLQPHV